MVERVRRAALASLGEGERFRDAEFVASSDSIGAAVVRAAIPILSYPYPNPIGACLGLDV